MIEFTRSCGKKYRVKDGLAGKRVKCKQCGDAITVPNRPEERDTIGHNTVNARAPGNDDAGEVIKKAPPKTPTHMEKMPPPSHPEVMTDKKASPYRSRRFLVGASAVAIIVILSAGALLVLKPNGIEQTKERAQSILHKYSY